MCFDCDCEYSDWCSIKGYLGADACCDRCTYKTELNTCMKKASDLLVVSQEVFTVGHAEKEKEFHIFPDKYCLKVK
ncbi:MAG: hypothetical protein ACTSVI_00175 [Promethearchaeota archaeon]